MPMTEHNSDVRRTMIFFTALSLVFLPLFANMIAVFSHSWEFGRVHSFQLALFLVLIVVTVARWRLRVGIAFGIIFAVIACITLLWSSEPLAYLTYTAFLLGSILALFGLIYLFTRRPSASPPQRRP